MRRWRKILFVTACGIALLIACAWPLSDALTTKPIMVRLPDQTTLTLYAITHGTNQSRFPDPNPFKQLIATVRQMRVRATPSRIRSTSSQMFDESSAYWWFKVSPSMQPTGRMPPWHTTIHSTTNNPFVPSTSGYLTRLGRADLIGIYVKDCPTNTPTMVINFQTYKEMVMAGESHFGEVITNITVPNPMYRR